jgi:hypothetical protein
MKSHPRRQLTVLSAVAIAVLGLGASPAGADPANPGPDSPAPANAAIERQLAAHHMTLNPRGGPVPDRCTLLPSGHYGTGEWTSCLRVSATLSAAPSIGQRATLRFEVQAQVARPDVDISVELPAGLRFDRAPAGLKVAGSRATGHRSLAAGAHVSYQGTVVAVGSGTAEIKVRASVDKPYPDAGYDSVFLTVAPAGGTSRLGIEVSPGAPDPGPNGPDGLPAPFSDDPRPAVSAAGTACVVGRFLYTSNSLARRPARFWQVEAWDSDTFSLDDLLAIGLTDENGNYQLCFDNSDEFGSQDVSMRFRAQNPWWGMQPNVGASRYTYRTAERGNIPDGTTMMPEPSPPAAEMLGIQAYDEVADAWKFVGPGEHCWNGRPGRACKQIQVVWNPTAAWQGVRCGNSSDCYAASLDTMFLSAGTPGFRNVVAHEAGHAIMDDAYHDNFPATTGCDPHFINLVSSDTCAWVEGFADWVGVATYGGTVFTGNGFSVDLETATWGTANMQTGQQVEARVAGVLLDLVDGANEGPWDRRTESVDNIWLTVRNHMSSTFDQFWGDHRRADGLPVDTPDVQATLYQNTILFGVFYDGLADYAEQSRPADGILEGFSFNTDHFFWSAIAVRPPDNGSSYNLFVWDDPGANILKVSAGTADVNFVAVDSNRRPFGDYYTWVHHAANGAAGSQYQIELGQGADFLSADTVQTVHLEPGDVVVVRDALMSAGQTSRFLAFPSGGLDVDEFLMQSDSADASTWVRSRSEAVASSATRGVNGFEDFTYTATAFAFYGFVLVNKSGTAGNVTLQRIG